MATRPEVASPDRGCAVIALVDPEGAVARARAEHPPVVTSYCLFSGGNDSTVLAHRLRDHYDTLAFIDTGTAIPGVREFVEAYARWLGKPLRVLEHDDNAYRRMVLGSPEWWSAYSGRLALRPTLTHAAFVEELRAEDNRALAAQAPSGFPGPGGHRYAYIRLKERQVARLVREAKTAPRDRVMLLTGVRRDESARRMGTTAPILRDGAQVWVAPLVDWSNEEMRAYRAEHEIPQSDVAALIHRSGECNCGAFAAPGEREMMQSLWPAWFDETICSLERECVERGIPACRWGQRPPKQGERLLDPDADVGPLCSDCVSRVA